MIKDVSKSTQKVTVHLLLELWAEFIFSTEHYLVYYSNSSTLRDGFDSNPGHLITSGAILNSGHNVANSWVDLMLENSLPQK